MTQRNMAGAGKERSLNELTKRRPVVGVLGAGVKGRAFALNWMLSESKGNSMIGVIFI